MSGTLRRAGAALFLLIPVSGLAVGLPAQMHHPGMAHRHMSLTSLQPGTAADTARAIAMVQQLRSAIVPYQTLEAAEAAGYHARRDSTTVRAGKLLHVGKRMRRANLERGFDPSFPQSLLYRRMPDGSMRLAGAMFVAPFGATAEELDVMVPLSVAHWHKHVNVCVAADRSSGRKFPRVATREECEAVGGRFRAESRYMIHVMTDAGDDVTKAFPQGRDGR